MLDRLLGGRLELFQLGFARAELPGPRELLSQTCDLGLQVRGLLPPLGDFGVRPRGPSPGQSSSPRRSPHRRRPCASRRLPRAPPTIASTRPPLSAGRAPSP